jgi:hypothetical protein
LPKERRKEPVQSRTKDHSLYVEGMVSGYANPHYSLYASFAVSGQTSSNLNPDDETCGPTHLLLTRSCHDQAGIWSSPSHGNRSDALWFVPFAGATDAAIYLDADAQRELWTDQNRIDTSQNDCALRLAIRHSRGGSRSLSPGGILSKREAERNGAAWSRGGH